MADVPAPESRVAHRRPWRNLTAHSLGPIGDALTTLLAAGKTDGTIRSDVDARDAILLIGYLTRLDEKEWDTLARHLLTIVLDGLRQPDAAAKPMTGMH